MQLMLPPLPTAAAKAREALEVFSDSLPAATYADLRVVITELITNGVKYGPGSSIEMWVALDHQGRIRGAVNDGGTGGVAIRAPGALGGGLGLLIVDSLATWGVYPDSSHVWFEMDDVTGEDTGHARFNRTA
jgi:two-component sensor histidine kinase